MEYCPSCQPRGQEQSHGMPYFSEVRRSRSTNHSLQIPPVVAEKFWHVCQAECVHSWVDTSVYRPRQPLQALPVAPAKPADVAILKLWDAHS